MGRLGRTQVYERAKKLLAGTVGRKLDPPPVSYEIAKAQLKEVEQLYWLIPDSWAADSPWGYEWMAFRVNRENAFIQYGKPSFDFKVPNPQLFIGPDSF